MMFLLRIVVIFALAIAAFFGALSFSEQQNSDTMAEILSQRTPEVVDAPHEVSSVYPTGLNGDVVFSGLPSFGRLAFYLPIDAGVTKGEVEFAFHSEVPSDVHATLRLTVNGTRRVEAVLEAGVNQRLIRFPLHPEDLKNNNVQLGVSLVGESVSAICGLRDPATVLQVLPETRLVVGTVQPVSSLLDRFRVGGAHVPLQWEGAENPLNVLLSAAALSRAGIDLRMSATSEGTFTLAEAEALLPVAKQDRLTEVTWPLPLATASAVNARQFQTKNTWRNRFLLEDLPESRLPGGLEYSLLLGPMSLEGNREDWLVSVLLNGRVVETLRAPEGVLHRRVRIAEEFLLEENTLEITAGVPAGVDGVCNSGPHLVAELLPNSVLTPGGMRRNVEWDLEGALGAKPNLSSEGLTDFGGVRAFALAQLVASLPVQPTAEMDSTTTAVLTAVRPDYLPQGIVGSLVIYKDGINTRVLPVADARRDEKVLENAVVLVVTAPN